MIRSQGVSSSPLFCFLRPRLRGALGFPFASPAMPPIAEEPPATQRGKGRDTRQIFFALTDFLNFFKIHFSSFSLPCELFSAFQFLKAQASSDWEIFCISNSWTCLKICWGPRLERRLGGPSNCLQQCELNASSKKTLRFSSVASLGSCQPPILALA